MRALWSRAAQVPGTCRCLSCVSSAPIVASCSRRNGLRNRLCSLAPSSTLVHTTIFTAWLTMDAKAKTLRNSQWEEAFTQLREALDQPRREPWTAQEKLAPLHDEQREDITTRKSADDSPGAAVASEVDLEPERIRATIQQQWDNLRNESRIAEDATTDLPVHTGIRLVRNNLPPQSLWAPDTTRLNAKRRRHTWKKLAMQELSTGLLIHDLIKHVNLIKFTKSARHILEPLSPQILEIACSDQDKTKVARQYILQNIEALHVKKIDDPTGNLVTAELRATQTGIPRYHQDADGDFHQICKQLNDGVEQLFRPVDQGNEREKALAVAKICHNLLVSTASPDLRTFNLLLSGFTVWRADKLIDSVIASFYASKIRPNETTCRLILEHYTRQNCPDSFSRFVARMRGVAGGLMLANPSTQINAASENRLVKDQTRVGKIYQKVYPTPLVFASLIDGVLKFADFDRALDVYYELKNDGWGLSVRGLTKLLGDCVRRGDWEGGAYVWEEINSIKNESRHDEMARAYQHMLSLCSVTGNTVAFNQVLNEVVKRGHDRKAIITAAMKTTRWAQQNKKYSAPAWAADNLMIAVSDYVSDTRSDNMAVEDSLDAEQDWNLEFGNQSIPGAASIKQADHHSHPTSTNEQSDAKEVWSNWVEREFGEKPKDPEL